MTAVGASIVRAATSVPLQVALAPFEAVVFAPFGAVVFAPASHRGTR